MGLEGIHRHRGAPFWRGSPLTQNHPPGASGSLHCPEDPAGIKTTGEALLYIERLYKAGRIDVIAGWLRRSPVFREAWQAIQQASQQCATAEAAFLALRAGRFSDGTQPPPVPPLVNPLVSSSPTPVPLQDEESPRKRGKDPHTLLEEESYSLHSLPSSPPLRSWAQGYQIYEKYHRYFTQPPELIDVRV